MQLFEDACTNEVYEGCSSLGAMLEDGDAVEKDLSRAVELYTKACDADDAEGCGRLGNLIYRGRAGTDPNPERALELLEKACEGGYAHGCSRLGSLLQDGRGIEKQPARRNKTNQCPALTLHVSPRKLTA